MKLTKLLAIFLLFSSLVRAQEWNTNWFSESETNGITIQNSYPKGGLYTGPVKENFNYSYLVFFTRVVNESGKPFEINVNFSAEPIAIPNSPNTYLKLFLPSDEMTFEKQGLFSYGITELKSLDKSTSFLKKLNHKEECLFYIDALFYQTKIDVQDEDRGGNRAEFVLKGDELFFRMKPQIELLPSGNIIFNE